MFLAANRLRARLRRSPRAGGTQSAMHPSREKILAVLRSRGSATVDELSRELEITTVTVRHHLDVLRSEGYVSDPIVRHRATRGRPQYSFELTEKSASLFPTNYERLAVGLLSEMEARSSREDLEDLLTGVGSRLVAGAPPCGAGEPLESRMERAVGLLNTQGYDARWELTPQGFLLHTCNCPYREVSPAHQELCEMDLSLVKAVLGTEAVERQGRVIEGHPSCSYLVRPEAIVVEASIAPALETSH